MFSRLPLAPSRTEASARTPQAGAVSRTGLLISGLLLLSGCSTLTSQDPLSAHDSEALPAACIFPRQGDADQWLRAAAEVVEARGYKVRESELSLGLVTGERKVDQPGLGAIEGPFGSRIGFSVGYGVAAGRGIGVGVGNDVYRDDPISFERISLVAPDERVRVIRDEQVINQGGYVIDARPQNLSESCQQIERQLEAALAGRDPREVR
ncbi:hypothetical protein FBG13_11810 [Cobetia marina]|uniref:hypothetical protein n=1 Tax=Cobetia TaxID=204286 RepID=UPI0010AEB6A6|nr:MULTISPECIES: hypothetical protein [Cobetia]MDH2291952.1 hypothetical protein [Cobetia sp. 10Alg 146]MDI6003097.1 hypothetical protein [Cobetia pacifica]TKD62187.1 hypothetical protein FBG13_11810 [Cobetia marina]GED43833.1 hypothetical protein HHA02_31620 [Cobetia marina]